MEYTTVGKINEYKSSSVNPAQFPDSVFEVYSVPIFDAGHPEYLTGAEIGSSKQRVQKDDVLLCKINPRINRVWVVRDESEHDCIASSEWIVIRNSSFNPEYLAWYFRSRPFQTLMTSHVTGIGGSLTRAQPKQVAKYPVPVVSRKQQDDIVSELNEIDCAIEDREKELSCLDTMINSYFFEIFGDLRLNPYNWDEINISKVMRGKASNGFFAKRDAYVKGGNVGVLGVANVVNRMYSNCVGLPTTNGTASDIAKYSVKYGDLLFCRSSLVAAGIGKASAVPEDVPDNTLFECHVIRLPLNLETVIPEYLQVLTTTEYFRNQILASAKTATMTTIGQDGILKCNILLPPYDLQKEYLRFVKEINAAKAETTAIVEKLNLLKAAIMQEHFG